MLSENQIKLQLSYVVDKYQQAMAKFHELEKKLADFFELFSNLKNTQEKLSENLDVNISSSILNENKITNLDVKFDDYCKKSDSKIDLLNDLLPVIDVKVFEFSQKLSSCYEKLHALEKGQENQKDFLTSIASSVNEKDKTILEQNKKIDALEAKIKDQASLISVIDQRYIDVHNFQDSLSLSIQKLNDKIDALSVKSLGESNFVKELLAQKLEKFSKHYDAKIADVKVPSVDGFVKHEELLKFTNDLDLTRLDAKNGYLKATNCAAEISMMGKKIEQLQLQLKSQSLNGG